MTKKRQHLTGFIGLRKIDITNKEVLNQCFFCFSRAVFLQLSFLLKEILLSSEGDASFRKSALTITCLFRSDDPLPGLRKAKTLFRDSLEMYVRFTTKFRKKFFVGQAPQNRFAVAGQAIRTNSALNAQTFFTVNRLSVSAFSAGRKTGIGTFADKRKKKVT